MFDNFWHLHFELRHETVARRAAEATHALNLFKWDTFAELFTIEAFDKDTFLVFGALGNTVVVTGIVDRVTLRAAFAESTASRWYFVVAVDCSLALLQEYESVVKAYSRIIPDKGAQLAPGMMEAWLMNLLRGESPHSSILTLSQPLVAVLKTLGFLVQKLQSVKH